MSFFDSILAFFGKKPPAPPVTVPPSNNATITRPKNRQVYEGRPTEPPDWASETASADLINAIHSHVVCRYAPKFEIKRIMSTQVGPDGNLVPEYEGIAGDCGAVKNFGLKVAKQNGLTMPYRYIDLNMAYRCCCGNPQKCPFYLNAEGDMEMINSRRL